MLYYCIRTITQTKRSDAMAWKFSSGVPVYLQLADKIRLCIISGEYSPGSQIPSVRQLAFDSATNPNTVQHAFAVLEYEGLIISKGTTGKFVTDNTDIIEKCRRNMAQKIVESFVFNMKQLGFSEKEATEMVNNI
jgi:DNA-binding transcriptional regulator YhcF (GntR family)